MLGAQVAQATGLQMGQAFTEGFTGWAVAVEHADTPYTVVGVLTPCACVLDRSGC